MAADETTPPRSSQVEVALIDATARLLAERGPALVSLRDIEVASGINKGQVHHYFGGKRGLIEAAVRKLASEHFEFFRRRTQTAEPLPLSLSQDSKYWRALVRIILDGDIDLACLELREDLSVPRRVLREVAAGDRPSRQVKAGLATMMLLELGWAAFRPYVEQVLEADEDDVRAVESHLHDLLLQHAAGHRPRLD